MLFRRVSIKAFRGIQDLEFYDLGRINLLVGQNNCGKTSVLEAMHVLGNCRLNGTFPYSTRVNADNTDIAEIVEYYIPARSKSQMLFISGYQPFISNSNLKSESTYDDGEYTAAFIQYNSSKKQIEFNKYTKFNLKNHRFNVNHDNEGDIASEMYIKDGMLKILLFNSITELDEYYNNHISYEAFKNSDKFNFSSNEWSTIAINSTRNINSTVQFMDLNDDYKMIIKGITKATLSGVKGRLVNVLHQLDADIIDLDRGENNIVVTKQLLTGDNRNPVVPLEYFGAATVRMLSLLIKLSECENGMLMIDEIDTAMHYTHLKLIWETLIKGAEEFNVQVFVTSHSDECVKALAEYLKEKNDGDEEKIEAESVRMYRLKKLYNPNKTTAMKYLPDIIASINEEPFVEYR